jgi:hypothetical protein
MADHAAAQVCLHDNQGISINFVETNWEENRPNRSVWESVGEESETCSSTQQNRLRDFMMHKKKRSIQSIVLALILQIYIIAACSWIQRLHE